MPWKVHDAIEEDTIAAETEQADDLATAIRTMLIRLDSLLNKNKSPSKRFILNNWLK